MHAAIPLAIALLVAYLIIQRFRRRRQFAAFAAHHKCQPPIKVPQHPLLGGLDSMYTDISHVINHSFLPYFGQLMHSLNDTLTMTGNAPFFVPIPLVISTRDPENIKAILSTQFEDFEFGHFREEIVNFIGRGIFALDGHGWRRQRNAIRGWFHLGRVADNTSSTTKSAEPDPHTLLAGAAQDAALYDLPRRLESHVSNLMATLREQWQDGMTVDLQPLFFAFKMDVASELMFGESPGCLKSKLAAQQEAVGASEAPAVARYRAQRTWHRLGGWGYGLNRSLPSGSEITMRDFAAAFDRATEYFDVKGSIAFFMKFFPSETWRRDCRLVSAVVDEYVSRAVRQLEESDEKHDSARPSDKLSAPTPSPSPPQHRSLLAHLVAKEHNLPRSALRDSALNVFFAARDTTAGTLSDLWWNLARHPEIFERLRHEILLNFPLSAPHTTITYEAVKSLPYLRATLKEVLRLHPVLPIIAKVAAKDTTLPRGGGPDGSAPVALPKGSAVQWAVYLAHRLPAHFGHDADVFRPERWLDPASPLPSSNRPTDENADAPHTHTHTHTTDDEDDNLEHHRQQPQNDFNNHNEPTATTNPANENDNAAIRPGWAFVPFNGGPRTCIGQQFALSTLSYVTVRLVQEMERDNLHLQSRDNKPWTEKFTLSAKNANGCRVAFCPR
jgi:cytochrome P450